MRTRPFSKISSDRKAIDADIAAMIRLFDVSSNDDNLTKYLQILYKIETSTTFTVSDSKRCKFNEDIINQCAHFIKNGIAVTTNDIVQLKTYASYVK